MRSIVVDPYSLAAPPFSPDDIAGLKGWWDASAITGLSDGDPVTTWEDLSADNRDATQTTGANKPSYQTNEINSLPIVRFDGDDFLDFTSLVLTDFTIFSVHKETSGGGSIRYLLGGSAQGFFPIGAGVGGTGVFDGTNVRAANVDPTGPTLVTCTNDQVWIEGVEATYSNTGTLTGMTISRMGNRTDFPAFFIGDSGELIIYNSQLGTTDRGSVENYLMDKWGL